MSRKSQSTNLGNLPEDQLVFSMDELKESGFSQYKAKALVEEGKLRKLNKSHYENLSYNGETSDFYYLKAYVPRGVVSLLSAATYYGYSLFRPDSIEVAIPRKGRALLPKYPPIVLRYYSDIRYRTGIRTVKEGRNGFLIYDKEKTVADVVSFREKVGIEETKEILTNYLRDGDRDLNKLMRYAKNLGCAEILSKYLEVLL